MQGTSPPLSPFPFPQWKEKENLIFSWAGDASFPLGICFFSFPSLFLPFSKIAEKRFDALSVFPSPFFSLVVRVLPPPFLRIEIWTDFFSPDLDAVSFPSD